MRCIIVDDEPLAQQILEEHISHVPFLKLEKNCNNAFEALNFLQKHHVDLIFLDTRLPGVSGIEFIGSLDTRPMFIFATAYPEHAVDAFDLSAVDYLLKPVSFTRFLKAANRAYNIFATDPKFRKEQTAESISSRQDFILVKSEYKSVKIQLDQILYIEGLRDYVKIFVQGGEKIVTLNSLKKMSENLPANHFLRVHKSFIVNTNKITSVTKNRIIINGEWIPVGDNYKSDFQNSIINKFTL